MNRVHDCYVARSATAPINSFYDTVAWFDDFGREPVPEKPVEAKPQPKSDGLKGDEARRAVMAAFAKDTHINREVRH